KAASSPPLARASRSVSGALTALGIAPVADSDEPGALAAAADRLTESASIYPYIRESPGSGVQAIPRPAISGASGPQQPGRDVPGRRLRPAGSSTARAEARSRHEPARPAPQGRGRDRAAPRGPHGYRHKARYPRSSSALPRRSDARPGAPP